MKEKECLHEWATGYRADLILYCKKCNEEVFDLYSKEDATKIYKQYFRDKKTINEK